MTVIVHFDKGHFEIFNNCTEEFMLEAEKWLSGKKVFNPSVTNGNKKIYMNMERVACVEIIRDKQ